MSKPISFINLPLGKATLVELELAAHQAGSDEANLNYDHKNQYYARKVLTDFLNDQGYTRIQVDANNRLHRDPGMIDIGVAMPLYPRLADPDKAVAFVSYLVNEVEGMALQYSGHDLIIFDLTRCRVADFDRMVKRVVAKLGESTGVDRSQSGVTYTWHFDGGRKFSMDASPSHKDYSITLSQ